MNLFLARRAVALLAVLVSLTSAGIANAQQPPLWVAPALPVDGAPPGFQVPAGSCVANPAQAGCPVIRSASYSPSPVAALAPVGLIFGCPVAALPPFLSARHEVRAVGEIACAPLPDYRRVHVVTDLYGPGGFLQRGTGSDNLPPAYSADAPAIAPCSHAGALRYENQTFGTVYMADHASMTGTVGSFSYVSCP